jgi:hypothetical protein
MLYPAERAHGCILLNARTAVGPIRALESKKGHRWQLPANTRAEAAFLAKVGNPT